MASYCEDYTLTPEDKWLDRRVYVCRTDTLLLRDAHAESETRRLQLAALDVMVAIGGRSRASDARDLSVAAVSFDRGRRMAFADMLGTPTVDLVRLLLLMSFYMLIASRRNEAMMYAGVTLIASSGLGLRGAGQYNLLPFLEATIKSVRTVGSVDRRKTASLLGHYRWRTFRSLRTFDLFGASLLGRPNITPRKTGNQTKCASGEEVDISSPDDIASTAALLDI